MSGTAPGWYADPTARYTYRYWSGTEWTQQVSNGSTTATDPTALAPDMVGMAPAPGSEAAQPAAAPTVQVSQTGGGAGIGTLLGVLIGLAIVVIIVAVIVLNTGDDGSSTTETPVTTEAPAPTEAP